MTCPSIRQVIPTCPCGRVLDVTVWHGDDDRGNDLCPTCSGCGCEPEERKTMTPEQELDPTSVADWLAVRCDKLRQVTGANSTITLDLDRVDRIVATLRALPDHSMCAQLVQRGVRIGSADGPLDPSLTWWQLEAPNGDVVVRFTGDEAVRRYRFAIPDPEPTVVERAAKVLEKDWVPETARLIAQALADAGLLREDDAR